MQQRKQRGNVAMVVVAVLLAIAIVVALGWVIYSKFATKTDTKLPNGDQSQQTGSGEYKDYRKDGKAGSGIVLKSEQDVDKLVVSDKLKAHFKKLVKLPLVGTDGQTKQLEIVVDRSQGDYAVGMNIGAYVVWGPEGGSGAISSIGGTQNEGFPCEELKQGKVPSKLVDGKCMQHSGDTSGSQPYEP